MHFLTLNENHFKSYYNICGNASLEESEVIFITETQDHGVIHEMNIALINRICRNHLLLVETKPFGKQIQSWKCSFTLGIYEDILIKGWDHPEFEAYVKTLNDRLTSLLSLVNKIEENLREHKWGSFLREDESFASLLKLGSEKIQRKKEEIRGFLTEGWLRDFIWSVQQAMKEVIMDHRILERDFYAKTWKSRLLYLEAAIEGGLQERQKVIVLLSSSLIIRNPKLPSPEFDIDTIENCLKSKKFVIISAKKSSLSTHNHPELWPKKQAYSSLLQEEINGETLEKLRYLCLAGEERSNQKKLPSPCSHQTVVNHLYVPIPRDASQSQLPSILNQSDEWNR